MQMAHSKLATLILGSLLLKQQWEAIWEWEQKKIKHIQTGAPNRKDVYQVKYHPSLLTSWPQLKYKYIHGGSLSQSSCIAAQQLS